MKQTVTWKYGLFIRVTYEGDPYAIEILIGLRKVFNDLDFGMILPEVGQSRVYGTGRGKRVKITRKEEGFCTVEKTEEHANAQTWETKYGYCFHTCTGDEKAMLTFAKIDAHLGGAPIPEGIGESTVAMTPSIGEVTVTRTGEYALSLQMGRSKTRITLDHALGK